MAVPVSRKPRQFTGKKEPFADVADVGANFFAGCRDRFSNSRAHGEEGSGESFEPIWQTEKRVLLASDLRHDFMRSRSF